MKELICKKDLHDQYKYYCNFTIDCDQYNYSFNNKELEEYRFLHKTYLYDLESELNKGSICIAFRTPGATRGHIELDKECIIKKIIFYEDACFEKIKEYEKEVINIIPKYIGMKLILEIN